MTSDHRTLLVFMKYPKPGQVKTRLAARIGPVAAANLYRSWIGIVLEQLQPLRGSVAVIGAITGGTPADFRDWDQLVDLWWTQPEGDLGTRLDAGFSEYQDAKRPVLAIGTDCLEIEPSLIEEAFTHLRQQEAVFGPAGDGGYYLVGTVRYLSGFFDQIRWSTQQTLHDHKERCRANRWRWSVLPRRDDLDTWQDWLDYCLRKGLDPERAIT